MYSRSRIGQYIQKQADMQSYAIGGAGGALTGSVLGAIYNKLNGKALLDRKALLTGALAGAAGGMAVAHIHSGINNKKNDLSDQHKELVIKNEKGENILRPGLYLKRDEYGLHWSLPSPKAFQQIMRSPNLWDTQVHSDLMEVRSEPFQRAGVQAIKIRDGMYCVSLSPSRDGQRLNMRMALNGGPNGHGYCEPAPVEGMRQWLDTGKFTDYVSPNLKPGKWDLSGNMAVYQLSNDMSEGGAVEKAMDTAIQRSRKWGIPDKWTNQQLNKYFTSLMADDMIPAGADDRGLVSREDVINELDAKSEEEKEKLFQDLQQRRKENLETGFIIPYRWSTIPQGDKGTMNCHTLIAGLLHGSKGLDFSKVPNGGLFMPSSRQYAGTWGNPGFFSDEPYSLELRSDLKPGGKVTADYLNNNMYMGHTPFGASEPESLEDSQKRLDEYRTPMHSPGNSVLSRIIDKLGIDFWF